MVRRHPIRPYDLISRRIVLSPLKAAAVLARDLENPVTAAVKLWGDDEEPFRNLIASDSADAKEWRRLIKAFLRKRLLGHMVVVCHETWYGRDDEHDHDSERNG